MANSSNDRLGFCTRCGEYLKEEASICPKCGFVLKEAIPPLDPFPSRQKVLGSMRSTIGAVCLVLSGMIGLTMSLFLMVNQEAIVAEIARVYGDQIGSIEEAVTFLMVFWVVSGVMALIGGYFAAQRRHFRIVLVGGVFALGTFGMVFLEGSIIGLFGLILIWLSRGEYR